MEQAEWLAECLNSALNVNREKALFFRGLLHDCESFVDLRFQLYLVQFEPDDACVGEVSHVEPVRGVVVPAVCNKI